ncbi:MAG: hypothetical protein GX633_07245 [Clostridiales bacterium]|jgi:hypothetical protein|nr:hypothetical protein [Clostridiales bacterium]
MNTGLLEKISFYCVGDEYYYTNTSSCDINSFFHVNGIEPSVGEDSLHDILKYPARQTWIAKLRNGQNAIYILHPITNVRGETEKIVMFRIRESALTDVMSSVLKNNTGMSFIADTEGRVISFISNNRLLTDNDCVPILSQLTESESKIKYSGRDYYCVKADSSLGDYTYTIVISDGVVTRHIDDLWRMWILIVALSVFLGIIAALLFSKASYRPIRALHKKYPPAVQY